MEEENARPTKPKTSIGEAKGILGVIMKGRQRRAAVQWARKQPAEKGTGQGAPGKTFL